MKLEFFQRIFEKYSDTKFNKNPSNGSRVFFMQMGGQTNKT